MITKQQYEILNADLEAFVGKHKELIPNHDYNRDGMMQLLALVIEKELDEYKTEMVPHETVVRLLEGIHEGLRHLAMDYYVSTK